MFSLSNYPQSNDYQLFNALEKSLRSTSNFLLILKKGFLNIIILLVLIIILSPFLLFGSLYLKYLLIRIKNYYKIYYASIESKEDRELMLELLRIEDEEKKFKSLINLTTKKDGFGFINVFGESLKEVHNIQTLIIQKSTQKVYPNINREIDEEQIARLKKEFETVGLID